jgi:hypothetical protein
MLLKEGMDVSAIVKLSSADGFATCQSYSSLSMVMSENCFQVHWDNSWEQRVRPKVPWFKVEMLGGMFSCFAHQISTMMVLLYVHSTL